MPIVGDFVPLAGRAEHIDFDTREGRVDLAIPPGRKTTTVMTNPADRFVPPSKFYVNPGR